MVILTMLIIATSVLDILSYLVAWAAIDLQYIVQI